MRRGRMTTLHERLVWAMETKRQKERDEAIALVHLHYPKAIDHKKNGLFGVTVLGVENGVLSEGHKDQDDAWLEAAKTVKARLEAGELQ